MKRLAAFLATLALTACANVSHHRTVSVTKDGTKTTDESESARFFFQREAAQKLAVTTKETTNTYSHGVTATGVQASGDVELIKAIGDAIGKGIGAAAQGAVAP